MSLDTLSVELVHLITSSLEVRDICALRLTSWALHDKSTQRSFINLFKHKSFRLTPIDLQRFVDASASGGLGCLLESCTIIGLASESSPATAAGREAVKKQVSPAIKEIEDLKGLLSEAFTNLKQHSPNGGITSISLQVVAGTETQTGELEQPGEFGDWRSIWDTARNTFRITVAALYFAGITLRGELEIFTSHKGCSLSCADFLALPKMISPKSTLGALKHLKISISRPHDNSDDYGIERDYPRSCMSGANIFVLAMQIIKRTMPALESVTLHWYHLSTTWYRDHLLPTEERETPDFAFSRRTWPQLKACHLENVSVTERVLLSFLAASHLQYLSLVHVPLRVGTWDSIFSLLVDDQSSVTSFYLAQVSSKQGSGSR